MAAKGPDFQAIIPKGSLDLINAAGTLGLLAKGMRDLGASIQRRAATYPPAQTSYVRTGNLGRRWTTRGPTIKGADMVVEVGNNAPYAPYVQGFDTQDPHQRELFSAYGWTSIEKIGNEEIGRYKPILQAIIVAGAK